jgi:hypothetical protein
MLKIDNECPHSRTGEDEGVSAFSSTPLDQKPGAAARMLVELDWQRGAQVFNGNVCRLRGAIPPGFLSGLSGEPTSSVQWTASTSNYFVGPANQGITAAVGTLRLVVKLLSVPDGTFRVVVADFGGGGFYISTANPTAGAIFCTIYLAGGTSKVTVAIPLKASSVGKWIVFHFTADGTAARAYMNGRERGVGTATGLAPAAPGVGDQLYLGRWSGGDPSGNFAFSELSYTPTVLTPAQIDADAHAIMRRPQKLIFTAMTGTTLQYVAADYNGGASWAPRIGVGTLTKNGTVTLNPETLIGWTRNVGRIMQSGDSQTKDGFYTIKGAEYNAIQQKMDADGWYYEWCGPSSAGWTGGPNPMTLPLHRAEQGETAAQAATGIPLWGGIAFNTFYSTYRPALSCIVFATNDLGADLVTAAVAWTRSVTLFNLALTGAPWCHIWTRSISVPHGPLYITALAQFQSYNSTLPANAAAYGITTLDIGTPAYDPSDGLHFLDGSTGYGIYSAGTLDGMAAITYTMFVANTWGG